VMDATATASPPFAPPAGSGVKPTDFGLPITPEQRKALFAAGKARGLRIDDLRALTPANSISLLTRLQASRLIDRLNAGSESAYPKRRSRAPRRPKGVYAVSSPQQRLKIESLRTELGWTPERLGEWLSKRHHDHGRPMATLHDGSYTLNIDSTADASAVIQLLIAVLAKTERARERKDAEARTDALAPEGVGQSQGGLASTLEEGSQT